MTSKLLLLLLIVGWLSPAPSKDQDDQRMIEGTWTLEAAELGGRKLPDEGLKGTSLIVTDGRYTYLNDHGIYKLVPAENPKAPKAMDVSGTDGPNKGKTFLAIYEVAGDTLKICYDLEGKVRPSKFAPRAGTRQFLAIYKRAKK